jgi:subtilisin family serine protease|tara:strand:+ start:1109 stop:2746 length:1638 start_codon:yes stop_codon:yes gene_type:complete
MNLYRKALGILGILAFAYFGGHYVSMLRNPPEAEPIATVTSKTANRPSSAFQEKDKTLPKPLDLLPTEDALTDADLALANELLLSFKDQNAYDRFIADAERAGISIIARNLTLKALRVRSNKENNAQRIRELAGENADIDFNYLVVTPTIPQPTLTGIANQPFKNNALDWLGVPEDNDQWGKGITIAILDTGIDDHPTLEGVNIKRINLVDSNENQDSEYNGHGTAIASLVAGGNHAGIAPKTDLLSIQVMNSDGTGDSFTLATGIVEAVDQGASIISMSLGSYGYSTTLENAIAYAQANNVILVASAGNDGMGEITYPARFDGVIGVAAIDTESQRAEFSNFSEDVDIAAPGVGVYAAWGEEKWTSFSGTSAATPFVAGGIAATLSLYPKLTPQEAVGIVLTHADDASAPGIDVNIGHGTLNMDRILDRDQSGIADAALADFYLDFDQATETTIPLMVTVQNRGTESLRSVSIDLVQNEGQSQRIYLGQLIENQTTSYTIYLDRSQLTSETGYTIQAQTYLGGQTDSREDNDSKSGHLKILPEN